jgi:N-acetylglutamate synthase-like GNAT family acetyltransferase
MDVSIRVAEERDSGAACEVLRCTITECCTLDHRDDQVILEAWLANKTPENVRSWFNDASSYAVVAEAARGITGVAKMENTGEITLCYIIPEVRFAGVGEALLAELESRGHTLGLRELRLISTKTAHAFYLRNGFETSGPPDSSFAVEGFPMVKVLGMP